MVEPSVGIMFGCGVSAQPQFGANAITLVPNRDALLEAIVLNRSQARTALDIDGQRLGGVEQRDREEHPCLLGGIGGGGAPARGLHAQHNAAGDATAPGNEAADAECLGIDEAFEIHAA